jgi:hypothetical protein
MLRAQSSRKIMGTAHESEDFPADRRPVRCQIRPRFAMLRFSEIDCLNSGSFVIGVGLPVDGGFTAH